MAERRIAHLDMDAFYASVELLSFPELRGQPLVIGGRRPKDAQGHPLPRAVQPLRTYRGRGVVTTATYEARSFGVRSGMGLMKAAALAPEALLLSGDFEAYGRVSRAFKAAVAGIAPCIEDRGIDEIYMDLTDLPGETVTLARQLKEAVFSATGLTCSVGVTPNKLLSKIASELQKPNGLTVLTMADIPERIWPLSVSVVNGIGPKASEKLRHLGLDTIGALAQADPLALIRHFGPSYGAWLHEASHGRDSRPIVTSREAKSINRETTFERDLHPKLDRELLSAILLDLCIRLAGDLLRKEVRAKSVGIKLRYEDFKTVTRDVTLTTPVADAEGLREAARSCLKRVPLDRRLRLLGLRASGLISAEEALVELERQSESKALGLPLFEGNEKENSRA